MDLSIYCPFCLKHTSVKELIKSTGTYVGGSRNSVTTDVSWNNPKTKERWWMGQCNSCNGVLLILGEGQKIYPTPQPTPTDNRIPELIRNDIVEAKICFSVSAFNATGVMARRALHSICIDKGVDRGAKDIKEQIKSLKEKGIITEDLSNWANEIKLIGDDGAHPNRKNVEIQDAEDILKLSEKFVEVIYVMPAMARELKEKRDKKISQMEPSK